MSGLKGAGAGLVSPFIGKLLGLISFSGIVQAIIMGFAGALGGLLCRQLWSLIIKKIQKLKNKQ